MFKPFTAVAVTRIAGLAAPVAIAEQYPADTVADAVRAGILRGASVGFIPLKWAFAKDRPLGINFSQVRLLEWSVVSIPANPVALLHGAVSGKAAAGHADLVERRRDEARLARVDEARRLRMALR